jgi:hypothetical protein
MKLSKLTLEWLIYHAQHSDVAGYTELKIIEEINEALSDDTLEIEGYEKSEWIKFDPDNPKTFPPQTEEGYIIAYENETVATGIWWGAEKIFISVPRKKGITHWRPLPKPPTETEEAK